LFIFVLFVCLFIFVLFVYSFCTAAEKTTPDEKDSDEKKNKKEEEEETDDPSSVGTKTRNFKSVYIPSGKSSLIFDFLFLSFFLFFFFVVVVVAVVCVEWLFHIFLHNYWFDRIGE
jgi:Flp pilus assembly protein TadB